MPTISVSPVRALPGLLAAGGALAGALVLDVDDGQPVGAGNPVTPRDLSVFADRAAEPVLSHDPDIHAQGGRMLAPGGRALVERPVRAVALDGTGHPSHKEQTSMIRRYVIWRNNDACDHRLRCIVDRVPLESRIRLLACGFVVASGGSAVFVDQPVQYGFSADSLDIEVDCCDAGNFAP